MAVQVGFDSLPVFPVGPAGSFARFFHGAHHDVGAVSLMLGELEPGEGPGWHRHPYDELFVIHQGRARYFIGDEVVDSAGGDVVIARAGVPHRFENSGEDLLRMTAIHANPTVIIEWVEMPTP